MNTLPKGFVLDEETISESETLPEGFQVDQEEISFGEKVKGPAQQFGRSFLSEALSSPKTISDFVKFGSNWLAQKGVEQKLKQGEKPSSESLEFTQTMLKGLGFPSELLDKIGYPSSGEMEEMVRNFYEKVGGEGSQAPIEPRNAAERVGKTIGGFTGAAVVGGPSRLPQRLAGGLLAGTGSALAEEAGAGTGGQLGAAFALAALVSLASQIKSGKINPSSKQLQQLEEFGMKLGLTPEELTPLLQSEAKLGGLSKLAKVPKETTQTFKSVEKKLGSAYDRLKEKSSSLPNASKNQVKALEKSFNQIVAQLEKSKMPGDDKLQAIKKIEGAADRISKEGINFESIMETYLDVNRSVNWNSYSGGKKDLAKIKQPLKDLAKEISPQEGKNFEKINELYGKFKKSEKALTPGDYQKIMNYGKYFSTLGALSTEMATGNFSAIPATIGAFLTVDLGQKLAGKLLTDPKYQNVMLKATSAIKNGSRSSGLKTFGELRDLLIEDFPEESKEVDWKELQKDEILDRSK